MGRPAKQKQYHDTDIEDAMSSIREAIENEARSEASSARTSRASQARVLGGAVKNTRQPQRARQDLPLAPRAVNGKEADHTDSADIAAIRSSEFSALYDRFSQIAQPKEAGFASILGGKVRPMQRAGDSEDAASPALQPVETASEEDPGETLADMPGEVDDYISGKTQYAFEPVTPVPVPEPELEPEPEPDYHSGEEDWGYGGDGLELENEETELNLDYAQSEEAYDQGDMGDMGDWHEHNSAVAFENYWQDDYPDNPLVAEVDAVSFGRSIKNLGETLKAELDQIYNNYIGGRITRGLEAENSAYEPAGIEPNNIQPNDIEAADIDPDNIQPNEFEAADIELNDVDLPEVQQNFEPLSIPAEPGEQATAFSNGKIELHSLVEKHLVHVLAEWAEDHLPEMAERIMREEIIRLLSRQADD